MIPPIYTSCLVKELAFPAKKGTYRLLSCDEAISALERAARACKHMPDRARCAEVTVLVEKVLSDGSVQQKLYNGHAGLIAAHLTAFKASQGSS